MRKRATLQKVRAITYLKIGKAVSVDAVVSNASDNCIWKVCMAARNGHVPGDWM